MKKITFALLAALWLTGAKPAGPTEAQVRTMLAPLDQINEELPVVRARRAALVRANDPAAATQRCLALDAQLDEDVRYGMVAATKEDFVRAARFAKQLGPSQARPLYEASLRREPKAYRPAVKLSDVAFLLGDPEGEKLYRQRVYGVLGEEP